MALTPQITLTATLDDIAGGLVGSVANPSQVEITLCGYGPILPCVPGTCNIDKPGPIRFPVTDGEFTTLLWGNDVIFPLGTYYQVTLLDDRDNVVQAGAFQFNGEAVTIDLSDAIQIGAGVATMFAEAPAGDMPGDSYRLSKTPVNAILIGLFYNGDYQQPGINYTLAGRVINLNFETVEDDNLWAVYVAFATGGIRLQPGITVQDFTPDIPGTVFTLTSAPLGGALIGLFYNGKYQSLGVTGYSLAGVTITLTFSTFSGDDLYAVYIAG